MFYVKGFIATAFILCVSGLMMPGIAADDVIRFYSAEPFVEYLPPNVDLTTLQSADKLGTFATAGEYEPLTCAMYSPEGVQDIRITVSPFRMGNRQIPADYIDLRIVKYWFQRGYRWQGRFLIPDMLFHDDNLITVDIPNKENILNFEGLPFDPPALAPFSIPAGTVKQLWITIHVPGDALPGRYHGELSFQSGRKTIARLPVELDVLSFVLDNPNKHYGIYYPGKITEDGWWISNNYKGGGVNAEHLYVSEELYRIQCADLRAHGITLPQFNMPIIERADGTIDFTYVKKMMDIREEYDLKHAPFFATGLPNPAEAAESSEALNKYVDMVRQVLNFFQANGWPKPLSLIHI